MSKKIIIPLAAVLVVAFVYFSQSGGESIEQYAGKIKAARAEKEAFMKTSSESPFKNSVEAFEGLS